MSFSDVCKQCQAGNRFPILNGLVKPLVQWGSNGFIRNNNNCEQASWALVVGKKTCDVTVAGPSHCNHGGH